MNSDMMQGMIIGSMFAGSSHTSPKASACVCQPVPAKDVEVMQFSSEVFFVVLFSIFLGFIFGFRVGRNKTRKEL